MPVFGLRRRPAPFEPNVRPISCHFLGAFRLKSEKNPRPHNRPTQPLSDEPCAMQTVALPHVKNRLQQARVAVLSTNGKSAALGLPCNASDPFRLSKPGPSLSAPRNSRVPNSPSAPSISVLYQDGGNKTLISAPVSGRNASRRRSFFMLLRTKCYRWTQCPQWGAFCIYRISRRYLSARTCTVVSPSSACLKMPVKILPAAVDPFIDRRSCPTGGSPGVQTRCGFV